MHENDAISFHDGGRNVKIKDHIRDRREKKKKTHFTLEGIPDG